ncbi:short chain dehydrogenase/reductase family oxidoreductase, partial [mine drainage metagenome]
IGLAIAEAFAQEGARLVLAARSEDALRTAAQACQGHGSDAIWATADVRRREDVERLFETAMGHFGRVDILVNNAAVVGADGASRGRDARAVGGDARGRSDGRLPLLEGGPP